MKKYLSYKVAPTSYKWDYNPKSWPYKWVTGAITPKYADADGKFMPLR